jgi:hypothetical protein
LSSSCAVNAASKREIADREGKRFLAQSEGSALITGTSASKVAAIERCPISAASMSNTTSSAAVASTRRLK